MISQQALHRIKSKLPPPTVPNILIGLFLLLLTYDGLKAVIQRDYHQGTFQSSSSTLILEECKNAVQNGNFEQGTDKWKAIGPDTGLYLISIDSTKQDVSVTSDNPDDTISRNSVNALSTVTREQYYFGMSQDLNLKCLNVNEYYEVSLKVMIHDESNSPVTCEPYRYYFDPKNACPALALKIQTSEGEMISRPIAKTVGPWKKEGWNTAYGIFQATPDIFHQQKVEIYVTDAPPGYNEVISDVVIKPVSTSTAGLRTCAKNLIINGDAETGDARFWFLKGGGEAGSFGTLEVVSPGTSLNPNLRSKYAFYHHGDRSNYWSGMWQKLDQNCMGVNSKWKITFQVKLLDPDGNEVYCDRIRMKSCPGATIESITYGGGKENTDLQNSLSNVWKIGDEEWNLFEAEFIMTQAHKDKDETWFYITGVEPTYGYKIDNISVTPISY